MKSINLSSISKYKTETMGRYEQVADGQFFFCTENALINLFILTCGLHKVNCKGLHLAISF